MKQLSKYFLSCVLIASVLLINFNYVFAVAADVSTDPATSVDGRTATLNGTINSDGGETLTVQGFQYGTTTSYGSITTQNYVPVHQYSLQFGSEGSGNGQFGDFNSGIDTDSFGNVYVGDNTNYRVQKFDSNGNYLSQFGTNGTGNGQFGGIAGVAIDQANNIYVVDTANHRVQKFNSSGTYLSQFGVSGSGDGEFDGPFGIALDASGNIYVTDGDNNRVQKFNSSGTYLSQFGVSGSGDGEFDHPRGIAIEPNSGDIYVVDMFNQRVQIFNSSGVYKSFFANDYFYPVGITIDPSGLIYIGDQGHSVIATADLNGSPLSNFAETGSDDGQVSLAYSTTVDASGSVYILDTYNHRVQKFLPVSASGTFSEDLSDLSCGTTYHYRAYLTNQSGTSYGSDQVFTTNICDPVVETSSVSNITASSVTLSGDLTDVGGELNTIQGFQYGKTTSYGNTVSSIGSFGSGVFNKNVNNLSCGTTYHYRAYSTNSSGTGFGSDDTFTTSTCLPVLSASVVSKTNNGVTLSASITNNLAPVSTVRGFEYGLNTSYGTNISETGLFNGNMGYLSSLGGFGNGDGELNYPMGITIDSSGNIYVSDSSNNRIQKFDSNGNYLSQFGTGGSGNGELSNPFGIAIDSSGNIYVSDSSNNRIQKFDSNGNYLSQFGTGGNRTTQFSTPSGIAIDSSGNIYIVDTDNNRIKKYNSQGVYQMLFGTYGSGNGEFDYPYGIALDSSNNIYVADYNNNRIQKFDSNGIYLSQFGTLGTGNGQFDAPIGVFVDPSGNIYVTEYNNNRIQKFDSNGNYLSQLGEQGSSSGQFDQPYLTTMSPYGDIYIADSGNNRIVKLSKDSNWTTSISGLACDTTYYYRAYSTSSNGDGYSSDNSFRTNGCPGAINIGQIGGGGNFYTQNQPTNNFQNPQSQNINQSVNTNQPAKTNQQTPKFTFTKNLKQGMRDNEVKKLQEFLNSKGYIIAKSGPGSIGKETTYFGIATKNALIKYQKDNDIKPSVGYFGVATRGFVNSVVK